MTQTPPLAVCQAHYNMRPIPDGPKARLHKGQACLHLPCQLTPRDHELFPGCSYSPGNSRNECCFHLLPDRQTQNQFQPKQIYALIHRADNQEWPDETSSDPLAGISVKVHLGQAQRQIQTNLAGADLLPLTSQSLQTDQNKVYSHPSFVRLIRSG